ncbi:MAG TPA: DUF2254 domain-containing protein [Pseudonocardia sp.]|nr:DUF2254 domain-containing protein [Pseudonocardia sp.]
MSAWSRIRGSFWFLPALFCAIAVVLAEALIAVDQRVDELELGPFGVLVNRIGESGSRDVLGAIAGSVLTVAATSFSITIAVLVTASSTYGPRLVRNFTADRGNQFVLGVYAGTFLYSLLVLRSIRERSGEAFVPHLAVNVAVLLAVLSIAVLVYFINHIADSVQVFTLARQARTELLHAVDRLFPEELGRSAKDVADAEGGADVPAELAVDGVPVAADGVGYLQAVDDDQLLKAAEAHDFVLVLPVRPGSHVLPGDALAVAWPADRLDDAAARRVRSCFLVTQARSPYQDVDFGVLVLEEMAVRALSPSTNDPYTALNALDDLAAGLVRLAGRPVPSGHRYDRSGRLRVVVPRPAVADLVGRVFDAMRLNALPHPIVLHRTLELARQIGAASCTPDLAGALARHVARLVEAFERTGPQACDLDDLRRHAAEVEHRLRA